MNSSDRDRLPTLEHACCRGKRRATVCALTLLSVLSLLAGSVVVAQAAECRDLLARGASIADTYVMDFGSRDKLYVYVMRMPNGTVAKCTSQRPLGRR